MRKVIVVKIKSVYGDKNIVVYFDQGKLVQECLMRGFEKYLNMKMA